MKKTDRYQSEHRIASGWRKHIDQLAQDADMLALRGRLTVEEKLSRLEKAHGKAMKTLERCGEELGSGGEAVLESLGDIWSEISATTKALREEMADAVTKKESEKEEAVGASQGGRQ